MQLHTQTFWCLIERPWKPLRYSTASISHFTLSNTSWRFSFPFSIARLVKSFHLRAKTNRTGQSDINHSFRVYIFSSTFSNFRSQTFSRMLYSSKCFPTYLQLKIMKSINCNGALWVVLLFFVINMTGKQGWFCGAPFTIVERYTATFAHALLSALKRWGNLILSDHMINQNSVSSGKRREKIKKNILNLIFFIKHLSFLLHNLS